LSYFQQYSQVFSPTYLSQLKGQILNCPYFTINNLNRDFVKTKGFSIVFRRSHLSCVEQDFPYFKPYLQRAMLPECNAFYLNPLLLQTGSQVDPHIDRSLRSYCKTIAPPLMVSVLYVDVPNDLIGGELILRSPKRQVGKIAPQVNTLVFFQGDLTHSVNPVTQGRDRLSLVCEQYCLDELELAEIPEFRLESRVNPSKNKIKRLTQSNRKQKSH
jgi:hypothetical protein